MTVSLTRDGEILCITIDSPPVNALGQAVRQGLWQVLDVIDGDAGIAAAVLTGVGKAFSGGADIKEFGKPPLEPSLPDLLARLERCRVPVIAAINGVAMGGGLETALACRHRIAAPEASLALPEVNLGLIPGAGGTQRLPRLVGVKRAAEMVTSGKPVDANAALDMGLVDQIAHGDLPAHAIAYARMQAKDPSRPPLSAVEHAPDGDEAWLDAFADKLRARARGQQSPLVALEAVRAAGTMSFADGMARERELFEQCMASDQRKGLIHAFFGERAAAKRPELAGVAPRPVSRVGIVGAGVMGAGIAIACVQAGHEVQLFDANADALAAGVARVGKTLESRGAKRGLAADDVAAQVARVNAIDAMEGFADCDLIIEAVVERMDVKQSVFKALDEVARAGAVLASNTSYLDIDEMAEVTSRAQDVIGLHFFSPADVMRLLEVIRTRRAAPDALATAMAFGKSLRKVCVVSAVADGFIGNRLFKKYRQQAEYLVEDGALPQDVDRVIREFGFAMGPFQVSDLAGLDIAWHNRRREDATRDPQERYVAIADRLYELGRLGQKAGAGWYRYEEGDRTAHPDPAVEQIIADAAREKGVARRTIADDEIRDRLILTLIKEGAWVLEEGVAQRALDIDLVFLHGYGFPAYRGGPMFHADLLGAEEVLRRVRQFAEQDAHFWRAPALLQRLAENGGTFAEHQASA